MFSQIENRIEGIITLWPRIRINGRDQIVRLIIREHDDFEEDLLVTLLEQNFTVSMGQSNTEYGDLVIWVGNQIGEQEVFGRATIYYHESELWLQGKLIYKYSRIVTMGNSVHLQGIAGLFLSVL